MEKIEKVAIISPIAEHDDFPASGWHGRVCWFGPNRGSEEESKDNGYLINELVRISREVVWYEAVFDRIFISGGCYTPRHTLAVMVVLGMFHRIIHPKKIGVLFGDYADGKKDLCTGSEDPDRKFSFFLDAFGGRGMEWWNTLRSCTPEKILFRYLTTKGGSVNEALKEAGFIKVW